MGHMKLLLSKKRKRRGGGGGGGSSLRNDVGWVRAVRVVCGDWRCCDKVEARDEYFGWNG